MVIANFLLHQMVLGAGFCKSKLIVKSVSSLIIADTAFIEAIS